MSNSEFIQEHSESNNSLEVTTNHQESNHSQSEVTSSAFQSIKRKRKVRVRPNWYLIGLGFALLTGWLLYTFVLPKIEESLRFRLNPNRSKLQLGLESPIRELYQTCEYLAILWFFYLGASIGSFFNVLAGRLPVGKGVVFGGSKCPYCNTRLSFRDNIPILGYLSCKGRCSTCKLPIATRYLWMEVLVGTLFVVVAFRQLFSGGLNLPNFVSLVHAGIIFTVFYPKWHLIAAFVFHAMFFASLVMLAAADLEKAKFPWRAIGVFAALFAAFKFVRLDHQFVRWFDMVGIKSFGLNPYVDAGLTLLLGAAAGLVIGSLISAILPRTVSDQTRNHWQQSIFLIGIVLGWQAVCLTSFACLLLIWALSPFSSRESKYSSLPFFSILIGTVLLHHMFWGQIVSMINKQLMT